MSMKQTDFFEYGAFHNENDTDNPAIHAHIDGTLNAKTLIYGDDTDYFRISLADALTYIGGRTIPGTYRKGYNFNTDSFCFTNDAVSISEEYYTTLFENGPGKTIHDLYEENEINYSTKTLKPHGVCFGISYATAALNNHMPDADTLIHNLAKTDMISIGGLSISLFDYIKYAHIYWHSAEHYYSEYETDAELKTLYNKVKEYTDSGLLGVTIYLANNNDELYHEVLAVGYDGNDILIDDPNNPNPDVPCRLKIENGAWAYEDSRWSSDDSFIQDYSTDYYEPYQFLSTGSSTVRNTDLNETYIEGINKLSTRHTLAYINAANYSETSGNWVNIDGQYDSLNSGTYSGNAYWVLDSDTVDISNINGTDNTILVAGDDTRIIIECDDVTNLSAKINEDTQSVDIQSKKGEDFTISFETVNNDTDVSAVVSGETSGENVKVESISDGLSVEGLQNVSVAILHDNQQVNKIDTSKSGTDFEIKYDKTGKTAKSSVAAAPGAFKKVSGKWKYYINDRLQSSMTGMVKGTINGKTAWYYIKKGVYTKATGITQKADGSSSKWYFVKNGKYTKATGIAQRADKSNKKWYFVKKGVYTKATGIAQKADGSSKKWYFVKKGVYTKATGIAKKAGSSSNKWYFVRKGIYTKATGIAKKADGSSKTWFYVKNGVYKKATTVARKAGSSSKTKYYVKAGKLKKYTGTVKIGSKKYKVVKGVVKKVLK